MITTLAIDPGKNAGVALVGTGALHIPELIHAPVMIPIWDDIKNKPSARNLIRLVNTWANLTKIDSILIEDVHAMPEQGIASTAKFMKCAGIIKGALEVHFDVLVHELSPTVWKPGLGLYKDKNKKQALRLARKTFGKQYFPRAKDHDMAEAALMAAYFNGFRV